MISGSIAVQCLTINVYMMLLASLPRFVWFALQGLRKLLMIYIKECWADVKFSVNALFVDMKTFQVSCQEISPECTKHFHELLLWVIM